jgi:hypothetical protein
MLGSRRDEATENWIVLRNTLIIVYYFRLHILGIIKTREELRGEKEFANWTRMNPTQKEQDVKNWT